MGGAPDMAERPLVFVDADVLLACFDPTAGERRQQAQAWLRRLWEQRLGRTSQQVLGEFYALARQRFATALAAGDARSELRRYQLWQPWPADQATLETAFAVEARHGLSFWASLVVAAAQAQGCKLLLSESLPHEARFDGLLVLNPALAGPERLDASA
jgi:predicted nucleic acid-binding protein